jgi:hypothetical protein
MRARMATVSRFEFIPKILSLRWTDQAKSSLIVVVFPLVWTQESKIEFLGTFRWSDLKHHLPKVLLKPCVSMTNSITHLVQNQKRTD